MLSGFIRDIMRRLHAKQGSTENRVGYPHLLVNFVEHCWVVVFFGVVVEADHAILLVNASVDLTIFNLHGSKRSSMMKMKEKMSSTDQQLTVGW